VSNLATNAVKFTPPGGLITLRVTAADASYTVEVQDTGVGIPDEEQDKVFRPFERAATARHHAGLGLGLWIAQQIAQTSGGGITVQSRVGEGSTFRVELPL